MVCFYFICGIQIIIVMPESTLGDTAVSQYFGIEFNIDVCYKKIAIVPRTPTPPDKAILHYLV